MKFQVILNLKNSILGKKILTLISRKNFVQFTFIHYQQKWESLIPNWLFEEKYRKTTYIKILFCQSNACYALEFIRKLEGFTKEKYSFVIIWEIGNIRPLFNLKEKTSYVSSVVYDGKCSCGGNYIGETGPNITIRLDEHSDLG